MKYITIATDISCDNKYKITTWACYIRHDGGAIKHVQQFKKYYKNTALAETLALVNALTIARQEIPNWENSKIIIHNEIECVLTPSITRAGNVRMHDRERTDIINSLAMPILGEAGGWDRRKIKAHYAGWETSDNPAKYAMNRWCDYSSRRLLKSIRAEAKKRLRFNNNSSIIIDNS